MTTANINSLGGDFALAFQCAITSAPLSLLQSVLPRLHRCTVNGPQSLVKDCTCLIDTRLQDKNFGFEDVHLAEALCQQKP